MAADPTYKKIAKKLYEAKDLKTEIIVGKCDVSANSALAAQFDVKSIPAVFFSKGGKTWKYEGALASESVIEFVKIKHEKLPPLPFAQNPMGPVGISKGLLIAGTEFSQKIIPYLGEKLNVPLWAAFLILVLGTTSIVLITTFAFVFYSVGHAKTD